MSAPLINSDLEAIQNRLDYQFKDISLLERAVTHSSLSNQSEDIKNLERLEFLGDRVLGLLTAEELWRRYPNFSEGDMAPRLNALVRKESCARAAREIGLDKALKMSRSEEEAGGREKDAILGDACEALLGGLYIDGGLAAARQAYSLYWLKDFDKLAARFKDAKTALQEWAQQHIGETPKYEVINRDGPAHRPHFVVSVTITSHEPVIGEGGSKRSAQAEAAKTFLLQHGIWTGNEFD
ncbi:MAG: ribonuclease III [bacterium]